MPLPLSRTTMERRPASLRRISSASAPASMAFSTSSLTTVRTPVTTCALWQGEGVGGGRLKSETIQGVLEPERGEGRMGEGRGSATEARSVCVEETAAA